MSDNGNAVGWLLHRHLDEGRADKIAFREALTGRSVSYGSLSTQAKHVAGAFHRADVRREERVICLIHDQIEYPAVLFGAMQAGVVPILLNTLLSSDLYAKIFNDCRAGTLIVSGALWDVAKTAVEQSDHIKRVIVISESAPEGTQSFASFLEGSEPVEQAHVSPDECAFWLYSSGSTGQPKGVRHVHSSMRATAETYGSQVLKIWCWAQISPIVIKQSLSR